MTHTLIVMAGGALGAALRYHSAAALSASAWGSRWPLGTFAVNVAGAFAMGCLASWAMSRGLSESWRLFLGVGLLGGFTTFSAFSLDVWTLWSEGRVGTAAGYALLSVLVTVLALAAGAALTKGLTA